FPTKTVSVHSVIVRPGDSNCLDAQYFTPDNSVFPVRGFEGFAYAELAAPHTYNSDLLQFSNLTGGVLGSICASNYNAQLGDIGAEIADNARHNVIQMPCRPETNDLSVTSTPSMKIVYTLDNDNRLIFSDL